jgi:hypothetical protein
MKKPKRIGIVVLATNAYFILGLRFIKRFHHFYEGDCEIVYYFFSDEDPMPYTEGDLQIRYYEQNHNNWRDGTNSKFKNIVNIQYDLKKEVDYVYYFDADTSVDKHFNEDWFLGESVSGEHYGNKSWLSEGQGFNRTPGGHDYVSETSPYPYTYRYGAFFGGSTEYMITLCETLVQWQIIDTAKGYEPPNNDEGYLNCYFHNNPPAYTVPAEKFGFLISDKGGFEEIVRHPQHKLDEIKKELYTHSDDLFDIKYKKIIYE